jgi:hypothetical protein
MTSGTIRIKKRNNYFEFVVYDKDNNQIAESCDTYRTLEEVHTDAALLRDIVRHSELTIIVEK